jgi:hypothetical protein
MLRADHARVAQLFARFEAARGAERKEKLAERICDDLEVHTELEEKVFYPAVRGAIHDDALMDEATVEHQTAKNLIEEIRSMSPSDDLYDARVKVLGEYVQHHVKEEHTEMFPKARKSGVDLRDLAERMRARVAPNGAAKASSLGLLGRLLQ